MNGGNCGRGRVCLQMWKRKIFKCYGWLKCRICELPFGQSRLNSPARPRDPCFATDRCVESRGGFRGNSSNIANMMPSRFSTPDFDTPRKSWKKFFLFETRKPFIRVSNRSPHLEHRSRETSQSYLRVVTSSHRPLLATFPFRGRYR